MGAWGAGSFENDCACDWVSEAEGDTLGAVRAAFEAALAEDYLEVDEGSAAIAAAEVVATLVGRACTPLPEELTSWASAQPTLDDEALVAQAIKAVERVLGEGSEVKELWEEAEDPEWRQGCERLLSRLGGDGSETVAT